MIKYLVTAVVSIALLWLFFFLAFVVPNPGRLPDPLALLDGARKAPSRKLDIKRDFISDLGKAVIDIPNLGKGRKELADLDFFATNPFYKGERYKKASVSMTQGKHGMYLEQRNALYMPTPATISYRFVVPPEALLTFGASMLGRLNGARLADVMVSATIKSEGGELLESISDTLHPEPKFYWSEKDPFYQKFLRFWRIDFGKYNGRWYDYTIDLKKYAGRVVKLTFATKSSDGLLSHGFISSPKIMAPAEDNRPNVILAVIDTLRADYVGANNPGAKGLTPNIDKLASEGVRYSNVHSQANYSRGSFTSFLTGYPVASQGFSSRWGFSYEEKNIYYKRGLPAIANEFALNGYKTVTLCDNPFIYDASEVGLHLGFEQVIDIQREPHNTPLLTTEAIRWLKDNADKRFFMMFSLNTPHGPLKPPIKYFWQGFKWDKKSVEVPLTTLYAGSVAYADAYMGKLFTALEKLGLKENTIVIVTADHGVPYFKSGAVQKTSEGPYVGISGRFAHTLYDEETRVPMIVSYPGKTPKGRTYKRPIALLDLAPTLSALASLRSNVDWPGVSFADEVLGKETKIANYNERIIPAEGEEVWSIVTMSGYKYIRRALDMARGMDEGSQSSRSIREELFDLNRDPDEEHDLSQINPILTTKLRKLYTAKYPPHARVYKVVLRGVEKYKDITIEVKAGGGFLFFDVIPAEGNSRLTVEVDKSRKGKITARLTGITSCARIYFETASLNEPVSIAVLDGAGENLDEALLHLGPFALQARANSAAIGAYPDNFYIGDPGMQIDQNATEDGVYLVSIPFSRWRKSVSEGIRLDPELEALMKRWGYL